MTRNGAENNGPSKKRKTNKQVKTNLQANNKLRNTVMKTPQTSRKKKESKTLNIESATKDTIAETIAFVIKGQLTPIKPTPLPVASATKFVTKRLQKARYCKIKDVNVQKSNPKPYLEKNELDKTSIKPGSARPALNKETNPKTPTKTKTVDKSKTLEKAKCLTKSKNRKDLDSSIKQIIKKYAKKLNIKNDKKHNIRTKNDENKSNSSNKVVGRISKAAKIIEPKTRTRKQSVTIVGTNSIVKPRKKYVKRKDELNTQKGKKVDENIQAKNQEENKNDELSEILPIKIKEEKVDECFPVIVKVEADTENTCEQKYDKDVISEVKIEAAVEHARGHEVEVTEETLKPKNKLIKSKDQRDNKKSNTKKVRLVKKKALVSKKAQKQLEDKRRAKLLQFWNSPKRHRVASLNAIAKVHCLYENESKAAFDKMAENAIIKKEPAFGDTNGKKSKQNDASEGATTFQSILDSESDEESDEQPVKRILRDVPGLRAVGKHWDMHDSISSDNNSDIEFYRIPKKVVKVKKEVVPKKVEKAEKPMKTDTEKQKRRRKPKPEVYMDLKDMVVKKRMASLNASAILAASYSNDKKEKPSRSTDSSSYDSDSSAEEYFAAIDQIDLTNDAKEDVKQEDDRNLIEVHTTPNKKVAVILNQDTDVTITGVYVNSTTRSTHHEGYCSIAGMQYRISATSHTQTAATAVATETLLQSSSSSDNAHSDAQSCSSKSYTPLDALTNMQPPPGPGIHSAPPSHPGMPCQPIPQMASPQHRQHPSSSAFSSPHHGPPGYPAPPSGQGGPPPPGDSPVGFVHDWSNYTPRMLRRKKHKAFQMKRKASQDLSEDDRQILKIKLMEEEAQRNEQYHTARMRREEELHILNVKNVNLQNEKLK